MKIRGYISLILCICILLSSSVLPVFATEDEVTTQSASSSYSTDAQIGVLGGGQLIKNAESVFLYETNSDTLMYAWNPDKEMIPSSLVKIMTALLAVESGALSEAVTVKQSTLDLIPKDAVQAKLVANEVITLEELVYCMMVGSANDAAVVIAEHLGGDQAEFVKMMNARAQEIGCTGTVFTNAHGIQDNVQHTTARDMAKIIDVAIENEKFYEVFCAPYHIVPATNKSEERNFLTGNYLISQDDIRIYYDPRVTGGRTGVNNDGKRCLASTSESNGMKLICVVMGSESTYHESSLAIKSFGGFNETRELLDIGYGGYKTVQVLYEGQSLLQKSVLNGDCLLSLGSGISVSAVLPENATKEQLSYRYSDISKDITAPIKKGDKITTVEVWYGGLCVATADMYAMNSVHEAKQLLVTKEKSKSAWWVVLVVIIGVLCAGFGALVVVRRVNKKKTMRRMQRHNIRQNRRSDNAGME